MSEDNPIPTMLEAMLRRLETIETLQREAAANAASDRTAAAATERRVQWLETRMLGNGRKGLLDRVRHLETLQGVRGRWWVASLSTASAVVSAALVMVLEWFFRRK